MKNSTFTLRIFTWMYYIGFFVAWYAIARLFVLQRTLNRHLLNTPTYFDLQGDTIDMWIISIATTGLLLIVSIILFAAIAFLTRNGQKGRPFYYLLCVSEQTQERHWFGRRKRRHSFIIMRD